MRKRLYEVIEVSKDDDKVSMAYDILMMCTIIISIVPLAFKNIYVFFLYTDIITTIIFSACSLTKKVLINSGFSQRIYAIINA